MKYKLMGGLKINISHPIYQEWQGLCNQKTQPSLRVQRSSFLELPLILLLLFFTIDFTSFCQTNQEERVKTRKLTYNDFVSDYSINDTSAVIIDIFFDKKDNAGFGEMSFLPITVVLAAIPQTRMIGIGTTLVSLPLFLHGSYTLLKYRKKKLYTVLVNYKKTKTLPQWVRKKANKLLNYYDTMQPEE